jgi:hypothetical protein
MVKRNHNDLKVKFIIGNTFRKISDGDVKQDKNGNLKNNEWRAYLEVVEGNPDVRIII